MWWQRRISISLLLFIVLLTISIGDAIGVGVLYLATLPHNNVSRLHATSTLTVEATPTLNIDQAMDAYDFSQFNRGFAQAMANKQYDIIKAHTDTNNFQGIVLYANGGYSTWKDTYNQLTTGNMSFTVHYPIVTSKQKGYDCVGYSQHGIPYLMKIDAQEVQYIVGTTSEPNAPETLQTVPDTTVFVFEHPNCPCNFWLWRGYTLNNMTPCLPLQA